ncbi:MAG TPA: pseudaminic acid synthase [Vicinamibacterales bacterium]|nr:pseudaminic acid synthase [Vicinamibacterales bacterium]
MTAPIRIAERLVGPGESPYVIAEVSANHQQSIDRAIAIVRAAAEAGADAVKLQTYTPDTMTIDSGNGHFRIEGTIWEGRRLYELYQEAYTPWEWHAPLAEEASRLGLHFFSTPFDATAVEFLQRMNVPAFKIASFELVDTPLLQAVARTGKPVILSTGMSTLGEIDEAVQTLRRAGATQLALLKCTSAYPATPDEMNLATIPHMQDAFAVPVGLSDHTLELVVPVTAVTLGACIVEKHITLSRADGGPDGSFSLEPREFAEMVHAVRAARQAVGTVHYGVSPREMESRAFRRSLFVVQDVKAGEVFSAQNVRSIRPASGLHPRHLSDILGRPANSDIPRGTPLEWSMVGTGVAR